MRLYECDRCKSVNRIKEFRLAKQPVCGACRQEIIDFPFCRIIRRAWNNRALAVFFLMVAGFGFGIALTRTTATESSQGSVQPVRAALTPAPVPRNGDSRSQPISPAAAVVPPPPAPAPQQNSILRSDLKPGGAPFSVTTPGGSGGFYIKLLDISTGRTRLAFFVNAGSRFETKVAPGNYEIVYATGERWLGRPKNDRQGLFWPETRRFRLESVFSFNAKAQDEGVEYIGHDITLIDQRNGNLSKRLISEKEFGD